MSQPAFWLKVTNQYVIENFEELLTYVRKYNYDPENDTEEGDFCQTLKYLRDVTHGYAEKLSALPPGSEFSLDVSLEKAVRMICTSLLTAKKTGTDDHEMLGALINLIIVAYKNLPLDIERSYSRIIMRCMHKTPIKNFRITYTDLEPDKFNLGAIVTKIAGILFDTPGAGVFIYENRGCLILDSDQLTLTNLNFSDSQKAKLRQELSTDEGLEVKTTSATTKHDIEQLLQLYPLISGEFNKVLPRVKPIPKPYVPGDRLIGRITKIQGIKVEVETVDEKYEYERGNVFIDKQIGLVPQESFRAGLREGDYLPVYKNEPLDQLPFRVDLYWVQDFMEAYAEYLRDEDGLKAICVAGETWGTRWLTESGMHFNVFDNEIPSDLKDDYNAAQDGTIVANLSMKFADRWNIKGGFRGIISGEPVNVATFRSASFAKFMDELVKEARFEAEESEDNPVAGYIPKEMIRLYALLTYHLALRGNSGSSFERVEALTAAMLLFNMADDEQASKYVRTQLDFQKALISFARGATPASITFTPEEESNSPEMQENAMLINIIREYKEIGDTAYGAASKLYLSKLSLDAQRVVAELVRASNNLLGKIDVMELNRIKKTICSHLGVDDEYKPIFSSGTNYGVESEFLEFKTSCVYPPAQHRTSSLLADMNFQKWTILKAVCAFLNSSAGGDLLIGVNDSGFASGLDTDIETLARERIISEPDIDRLRIYIKLFLDRGFSTIDGRVSGTAITAGRVECRIETNAENRDIIRVKVTPYPWDVVKITAPDRPSRFKECYIRTSGASTPLSSGGIRETKLRKMKALDKNDYKTAKIMQAIDDKSVIEIKDYSTAAGFVTCRLEPFMILEGNKIFLAYDLDNKEVNVFRFSRFADKNLRLTDAEWKNENKHESREVDIFGAVATATSPKDICEVKLTDYARTLLIEDCDLKVGKAGRHEGMIVPNTDPEATQYPWLLRTTLNDYAGIVRFVRGLPADTSVVAPADLVQLIPNTQPAK